jgi:ankyrin repeat protein
MKAVRNSDADEVQSLLTKGHDPGAPDGDGNRPLHYAVANGNLEIAKMLLAAGADPNGRGYGDDTPLMRARTVKMGRLLIDNGADVAAVDKDGMTPLMHACNLDVTRLVKRLLELGVDVNAKSRIGATALIYGVYSRCMSMEKPKKRDIVDLLLAAGADINHKDKKKMTALKIAQQCKSEAYETYLIKKGAN